jgi:hypothetical protein
MPTKWEEYYFSKSNDLLLVADFSKSENLELERRFLNKVVPQLAQYFPGFIYFSDTSLISSSTELFTLQALTPECQNHGETQTSKTFPLPLQDGAAAHIWRPPALIGGSKLSTVGTQP